MNSLTPYADSIALGRTTLVLGGARSGKSALAERLLMREAAPWYYVATATADDDEMRARIAHHRARRKDGWHVIEEPYDLRSALMRCDGPILVDCITLWISNLVCTQRDAGEPVRELLELLPALTRPVIFVSNEIGLGIVPDNPLARMFRDVAGRTNQRLAAAADSVLLTVAGIPLLLKSPA